MSRMRSIDSNIPHIFSHVTEWITVVVVHRIFGSEVNLTTAICSLYASLWFLNRSRKSSCTISPLRMLNISLDVLLTFEREQKISKNQLENGKRSFGDNGLSVVGRRDIVEHPRRWSR